RTGTVMSAAELADVKDAHPTRVELVHVLSREAREVELHTGRLDGERLRALLGTVLGATSAAYGGRCGRYPMVVDLRAVLAESGVPADRVHTELFFVEDTPPEQATH